MIHHPYAHHDREKHQRHIRIDAQEYAQEHIQNTADYPVAFHCQIIVACRRNYQLGCTDKKHENTEDDAQGYVTLDREHEDCNAGNDAEQACDSHKPPVLDCTTGFSDQMFKMTFHNTKFN